MEPRTGSDGDTGPGEALARTSGGALVVGAEDHLPSARTLQRAEDSVPAATRRARAYVLSRFAAWCDDNGRVALPATAATLADYVTFQAEALDRSPASIEQSIGLIRGEHRRHGYPDQPGTSLALRSLKRHKQLRAAQRRGQKQAPPLDKADLLAMIEAGELASVRGRRDQVLLLLGWMMMARRSELVAIEHRDITVTADGLDIWVPKSKTDQDGAGRTSSLPPQSIAEADPVRAYPAWRDMVQRLGRSTDDGPLLWGVTKGDTLSRTPLTDHGVNRIVRRAAHRAGLPDAEQYTAHSLRAGGLVDALARGIPPGIAARHGGWDPESPMIGRYARMANRWRDNAMRAVW